MLTATDSGALGSVWSAVKKGAKTALAPAASAVKQTGQIYAAAAKKKVAATAQAKLEPYTTAAKKYKSQADQYLETTTAKPTPTQKDAGKRLQSAIVALGKAAGSAKLAIKVDGVIGQKTADAVNWAFTQHIGPGQAPTQYRTGKMPLAYIKANASFIAEYVEKEVARRKGTSPTSAASGATSKEVAKRLQLAIQTLGTIASSKTLKSIKVDGAIGPKTATLVNFVFTKHIGPGQAAAQYRTGKMPLDYIKNNATVLASIIEKEIRRRGGAIVTKTATATKKVKTKSGKVVTARKVETESGETYEVTDPKTGHTYFSTDPSVDPPPTPPEGLPEPSAEARETAAEASAMIKKSTGATRVVAPEQIPTEEAEEAITQRVVKAKPAAAAMPSAAEEDEGAGPAQASMIPMPSGSFFAENKLLVFGVVGALIAAGAYFHFSGKKKTAGGGGVSTPTRKRR